MKLLALGLLFLSVPTLAREYCSWDDAPYYFSQHEVRLHLAGNVLLEGAWLAVGPDSARFFVEKTSHPSLYAKGLINIPKRAILHADYRGEGEYGKQVALRTGTLIVPAVSLRAALQRQPRSVPLSMAVSVPLSLGASAAGLVVGHRVDRRWHKVILIR